MSASKAKRLAAREAKAKAKGQKTPAEKKAEAAPESVEKQLDMNKANINVDRTATGVYTSQERSRDIKIESFSLNYHGRVLIDNATIELNFGRRYGLIGANGSGKSTFLASLAERDIEIPEHIDVSHKPSTHAFVLCMWDEMLSWGYTWLINPSISCLSPFRRIS